MRSRDQFPRALATAEHYLTGPLRKFCEGQLEFGMLTPDIAYLRIRSSSQLPRTGSAPHRDSPRERGRDLHAGIVGPTTGCDTDWTEYPGEYSPTFSGGVCPTDGGLVYLTSAL